MKICAVIFTAPFYHSSGNVNTFSLKRFVSCIVGELGVRKTLYMLILSERLFHLNFPRDMVPYIYQRPKVMDYAIFHKQVSALKFVTLPTLGAGTNRTFTWPCHQNFFFSFHLISPTLFFIYLFLFAPVHSVPQQTENA